VLPTEKSLVVSFFQISQQPRRIRKNRNHQKFLLMQGYLSEVNMEFSHSRLNMTENLRISIFTKPHERLAFGTETG